MRLLLRILSSPEEKHLSSNPPSFVSNAVQLGFTMLPTEKPVSVAHAGDDMPQSCEDAARSENTETDERVMRELHKLLLETEVIEGKLICGSCGHEYKIKEGIANFLLPSHLGKCILHRFIMSPLDFADVQCS